MSASGLVYAVIVGMWAAVLVPMWLKRHDAVTENRSADRFGNAMRVLSRRSEAVGQREVLMPARPVDLTQPVAKAPRSFEHPATPDLVPAGEAARGRPASSAARAQLARRRLRTLVVLLVGSLVLAVLAVAGVLPAWAPVPAVALLVAFLAHLRGQARRAGRIRRALGATASAGRQAQAGSRSDVAAVSRGLVVETKGSRSAGHAQPAADVVAALASALEPQPAPAAADEVADGVVPVLVADAEAWHPDPWPLPTYVTAPKAVRPIRVIDLTQPGAWTSGRLLDDEIPVEASAEQEAAANAAELDALLDREEAFITEHERAAERRRAVGD